MDVAKQFLTDLKLSIEETARKNDYKPSTKYKPSSMKCIRNMYYQRISADLDPIEPSYILQGICETGSSIHINVQKQVEEMKNNGLDCEYVDVEKFVKEQNLPDVKVLGRTEMETKLSYDPLHMIFMADGIIKYKGQYYILELKTETENKWQKTFDVLEEHKDQGKAYSIVLQLPEIMFVYINRSNNDFKTFIYKPSEEDKLELKNRILTCEEHVRKRTTPKKPAVCTACMYCRYKCRCSEE